MKLNELLIEEIDYNTIHPYLIYSKERLDRLINPHIQIKIGNDKIQIYHSEDGSDKSDHMEKRFKERGTEAYQIGAFVRGSDHVEEIWKSRYKNILDIGFNKIKNQYGLEPYFYGIYSAKDACIIPVALGVYEEDKDKSKKNYKQRFIAHARTLKPIQVDDVPYFELQTKSEYFKTKNVLVEVQNTINQICESLNIKKQNLRLIEI